MSCRYDLVVSGILNSNLLSYQELSESGVHVVVPKLDHSEMQRTLIRSAWKKLYKFCKSMFFTM